MTDQQSLLDILRVDSMSDERDFVILMRQNQERIYRLAFHLLGNAEEAKDATQEAFIKAWRKLDTLQWETVQAWLVRVTVNLCLDRLRRRKFRTELSGEKGEYQDGFDYQLPDPRPDALEQCLSEEIEMKVREGISKLAPKYRAAVILRDLEGLSYREISGMLNMKINKVKSNIFRGRRQLKEILRPFFEVSG